MFWLRLLKSVLWTLPFIIIFFLNSKVKLNKADRARQAAIPVVAVLYSVITVFYLDKLNIVLLGGIIWLTEYLPFLKGVEWGAGLAYLVNALILLLFMLLKLILLPIFKGLWKKFEKLTEFTSGWFYEKDQSLGKWLFKNEYAKMRGYIKGFFYAFCISCFAVFLLSDFYSNSGFFKGRFYPVFGIIVIGEIVYFLSGATKREFLEDVLGEDEDSYRCANYGILRGILRDLFGARVLYEDTLDKSDGVSSAYDTLEEMMSSSNMKTRTVGEYFSRRKSVGVQIDVNFVKSCVNMLEGKSVLVNNPFYRDLTDYIMMPVIKQLISYNKCLIVVGRDSAADDVKEWIDKGIEEFTGTNSLWTSEILTENTTVADIGIIKFSDIHNLKLHEANKSFLGKVGFIFIIEPSRILASGQIGLTLIAGRCEDERKKLVFCSCDRNCDGLVDALSHVLRTSITEVTATVSGGSNSSQMYWNADGPYMHHKILPNISRYLGIGTEINTVAIKSQIQNPVWISSEKFPVSDMKWIAGQYYKEICRYTNLPVSQEAFSKEFSVESNLWNKQRTENAFITVEDEFRNLFEITRVFSSRAISQGFINVISENYFLRDYMIDNVRIFNADPKAIPTIVPDFARNERNTVMKLIMLMQHQPVSEKRIMREFRIAGIQFEDVYRTLHMLIVKHCKIDNPSLSVRFREEVLEDALTTETVKFYEINATDELYEYSKRLRTAYYIAEDEMGEKHYIGSKLYGHVFQTLLPGQFATFDGKYYEILNVSSEDGVVVRRAADHISGRRYYKQLRKIILESFAECEDMGSKKNVSGIEITRGFANISVETDGYLEMDSYGDIRNAKVVTINGIPSRSYRNKSVLRIKLPNSSEKIRFTVCLLLNEIFRTTYPESHEYVAAVMPGCKDLTDKLKNAVYDFEGECPEECFYIIEDSELDLGLVISVERNLRRYFEIISDVLKWHNGKISDNSAEEDVEAEYVPEASDTSERSVQEPVENEYEPISSDNAGDGAPKNAGDLVTEASTEPEAVAKPEISVEAEIPSTESADETKKKKKGFFARIFGRKDRIEQNNPAARQSENTSAKDASEDASNGDASEINETDEQKVLYSKIKIPSFSYGEADAATEVEKTPVTEETAEAPEEASEPVTVSGEPEEPFVSEPQLIENKPKAAHDYSINSNEYEKNCFLKFGFENFDGALDFAGTVDYLSGFGFDRNPLSLVRDGEQYVDEYAKGYDPKKYGAHMCDFCGVELTGGEYEVLKDGRERCNRCSVTAIKTAEDFKKLFKNVLRNMEVFYGIKLNVAVKVRMTDAKTIAKNVGQRFVATPGFDGRTLGFAKKDRNGYSLYVENGAPKLAAMATIAHELTHIWQYVNWNDRELAARYGKHNTLEVYEGMAKWAEIQYLILLGENEYAKRQEITTKLRDDEYGRGFIRYCEKYPLVYGTKLKKTPFTESAPL